MADYDRIKRNMQKMLDQGAQPQDIEEYARYEGVTPEEMQQASKPGWFGRQAEAIGEGISSAYQGVKGAIQGKQDPQFADVPKFTGEALPDDVSNQYMNSMFSSASVDDEAFGDVIKNALGDRFIGEQRDANNNRIITYKGDDGKEYQRYVNKPGLDYVDATRFGFGSLPYLASGAAIGGATKKLGLPLRAAAQGLGAWATSIASDIGARAAGSEQPISGGRAAMAAAFGAGGEAAVSALTPVMRALFKPQYFDEQTGTLTKAGLRVAKKEGLDPAEVQRVLADRKAGGMAPDADAIFSAQKPEEALVAAQTSGEFRIPTTKGQRTKDPQQLQTEEEMRRSLFGTGARDIITDFDTMQKARIQEGADTVRGKLAPTGAASRQEAGEGISSAFVKAQDASKAAERARWKALPDMSPEDGAAGRFSPILQKKFEKLDFLPDEKITPAAFEQVKMLEDYLGGKGLKKPSKLFGDKPARPSIDEMRRRLLAASKGAATGQDRLASKAIYESFNDWVSDIGQKGLIKLPQGAKLTPEQTAQELVALREFTKEQRRLFNSQGRTDAAGKMLEKLANEGDTPERIVQTLFGSSPNSTPKAGTVGALRRLKTVFGKNSPEAFDQVKAAYWLNLTRGKNGELLTPGNLRNNLDKAFEQQKSVMDVMFMPSEQAMIRRFRDAVDATTFVPQNPSGTSYALAGQKKRGQDNVLRYLLRRMGTRETFRGNTIKGSIYHGLSKKVPNVLDVGESMRKGLASQAVSPTVKMKKPGSNISRALAGQTGAANAERR